MDKSLFEFMPSKALIGLVAANGIKEKEFSNPEWFEAYKEFQKESGYKDIDVDKFLSYVKFYSRIGGQTMDRTEVSKDGAVTTTVTRMMHSDFQRKSIRDYREKMMGRYYGIR